MVDRRLLPVPADAALAVSVNNENARITDLCQRGQRDRAPRLDKLVREIQNRVAGKLNLKRALRPKGQGTTPAQVPYA